MDYIKNEIFSTLALNYAESGTGFRLVELNKYLHRIGNKGRKPTLAEITKALYELKNSGLVFENSGILSVADDFDAARQKEKYEEISKEKISKLQTPLKWLATLPFLDAIAITGSVAMRKATQSSDLDLLIIVKPGRIWTTRILAMIVTQFFGKRRYDEKITDRICLNYFIADNTEVPTKNIASANMLAFAMPILGKENFAAFISRNRWMEKFLYQCHDRDFTAPIKINYPSKTSIALEKIFGGQFGDWIECLFKKWQTTRIERKLAVIRRTAPCLSKSFAIGHKQQSSEAFAESWLHSSDSRVAGKTDTDQLIFTDDVLMLHYPEPKNTLVMERYNKKIKEIYVS